MTYGDYRFSKIFSRFSRFLSISWISKRYIFSFSSKLFISNRFIILFIPQNVQYFGHFKKIEISDVFSALLQLYRFHKINIIITKNLPKTFIFTMLYMSGRRKRRFESSSRFETTKWRTLFLPRFFFPSCLAFLASVVLLVVVYKASSIALQCLYYADPIAMTFRKLRVFQRPGVLYYTGIIQTTQ